MNPRIFLALSSVILLTACSDPIGSEKWCEKQGDKPKSEWTLEEAGDYTKYCVMNMDPKKWCEDMDRKDKGDWTANEAERYAKQCLVGRDD
jgi:hypothetical protein